MLAALYNIPTDVAAVARFSFHNRDAHELVVNKIKELTGVLLPVYPIDPMPANDLQGWLYQHQAMHNSVNSALGTTGNDLSDLDPQKLEQLTNWIQLHAAEHVGWGQILGID